MSPELIIIHLKARPDRTQAQLAEALGCSVVTICRALHPLVTVGREVHIHAWVRPDRGTGRLKALYRAGPGFNARYPAPSRNSLYVKAWRLRQPEMFRVPAGT